jgi:uncharacterized protein YjdB
MKNTPIITWISGFLLSGVLLAGCGGGFGAAADYFTGPVSGVGLKPATSIISGTTEQLSPVVVPPKTANKNVSWSSSDENVATVDQSGLVTAVAVVGYGETKTAVITATTAEGGFSAECRVTVVERPVPVAGVSLNRNVAYLVVGTPGVDQLAATISPAEATDQTITWSSDAPAIVSVNAAGLVTAHQAGTGTITARASNGISAACRYTVQATPVAVASIRLNKATSAIAAGKTETFYPVINPMNATNQNVVWTSSNPAIATVSPLGVVSGIAASATPVTITAKTTDGTELEASVAVTVTSTVVPVTGVSVSQPIVLLSTGRQTSIVAVVEPSNATDQNVIWTSDNPCALVDSAGVVTVYRRVLRHQGIAGNGSFAAVCYVVVTSTPTYSVVYNAVCRRGFFCCVQRAVDSMQYLAGQSVAVKLNTGGLSVSGYVFDVWRIRGSNV